MKTMRLKVLPQEVGFFDLFERAAANVEESASALAGELDGFEDPQALQADLRRREHEGDELTHEIMRLLNTSFVTPFDREDIHRLASELDDVVDGIEAVADLLVLHRIEEPIPEMRQMAEVLVRVTEQVHRAMVELPRLSGLEVFQIEINRLENEADRVYRKTIASLFSGDFRAMDVLKWKDILEELEHAVDRCEDIANTMESVVLKHA